jgi:putative NADPH-quinone reductase
MHTLIITANPNQNGLTQEIAKTYQKARETAGDTVELLDLYRSELRQDFLEFESAKNILAEPKRAEIQKKIAAADELVFAFPLWWYDTPAILKNFFDCNFHKGFAMEYNAYGKPVGLLKGKTARVFITSDAPAWFYRLTFSPFRRLWKIRLGTCGIKLKSLDLLGMTSQQSSQSVQDFLAKVAKRAA